MSKKTWILIASLVLSLAVGLGGSLAYLTDRDADANVFTMGNIDIKLTEEFEQGAELMPSVDITKDVRVENVGGNEAWVWVEIGIPTKLDTPDNAAKNVIHFNYEKHTVEGEEWTWWDENGNWLVEEGVKLDDTDIEYNVYTVLYQRPIRPGEITGTSAMHKVYLDKFIDIDPDGNMYHVKGGVVTDLNWNVNEDKFPTMHVAAYGIQREGIDNVREAYDLYYQQWGDNGKAEFVNPDDKVQNFPVKVSNLEELINQSALGSVALSNTIDNIDQNIVFQGDIDGRGNALFVNNVYDYNSDCTVTKTSGTVKHLQVIGAPRAFGTGSSGTYGLDGNLYLKNVYADNVTYALNVGKGNGHKVIIEDSELFGWISVDDAELIFRGGTMGKRSLSPIDTDTAYSTLVIYDDVTLEGIRMVELDLRGRATTTEGAEINIEGCVYQTPVFNPESNSFETVDGTEIEITAANVKELLLTHADAEYLKTRNCKLIVNGETVAW